MIKYKIEYKLYVNLINYFYFFFKSIQYIMYQTRLKKKQLNYFSTSYDITI